MNDHCRKLAYGSPVQRLAYRAINNLGILDDFKTFTPLLCGTIPIGVNTAGSDLDIVMNVMEKDFSDFKEKVTHLYGDFEQFSMREKQKQNRPVMKANFFFEAFEFELFAQPVPSYRQRAYQHMITEADMLEKYPFIKQRVISLKQSGMKTEPAFAYVLGLSGDPYEAVLKWGREQGILHEEE
jgi:hypothetical protein